MAGTGFEPHATSDSPSWPAAAASARVGPDHAFLQPHCQQPAWVTPQPVPGSMHEGPNTLDFDKSAPAWRLAGRCMCLSTTHSRACSAAPPAGDKLRICGGELTSPGPGEPLEAVSTGGRAGLDGGRYQGCVACEGCPGQPSRAGRVHKLGPRATAAPPLPLFPQPCCKSPPTARTGRPRGPGWAASAGAAFLSRWVCWMSRAGRCRRRWWWCTGGPAWGQGAASPE